MDKPGGDPIGSAQASAVGAAAVSMGGDHSTAGRRRPRRWRLCCVAAAVLAAAGCSEEPEKAPAEAPVRPAKLIEIAAAETLRSFVLPADIEAAASADLAFQLAGLVTSIAVREGDRVAEGAEIARLDRRDLRTELTTAQANYRAADGEFQRAERLIGRGTISRAVHEQRKTRRDVAKATLDAARKRFDDGVLRAPFAGIVAAVHTEAFRNVAAREAVVTLQSTGAARAVVQVPATLLAESKRFRPMEMLLLLDAAPDTPIAAAFHSIATRADPARQTFKAQFAFTPPADLVVLPGMTGTLRATAAFPGETGIAIPIEAVLSEADKRYVWVVDVDSMTVSKREVTLGGGVGPTLPVIAGLTAGETVVAAGVSYLHEGMRIRRYAP